MKHKNLRSLLSKGLALAAVVLTFLPVWAADQENVLYNFRLWKPGVQPASGLIWDSVGNLYGTTRWGGNANDCQNLDGGPSCGVVFELTPKGDGSWSETVLHAFNGKDGANPQGRLVWDSAGNLYGTTISGGYSGGTGLGVVFRLSPGSDGKWNETVLHRFTLVDGSFPYAGLIIDSAGNLYGTTLSGGSARWGTVFEISPALDGTWKYKVLHSFTGRDGAQPAGSLVFDSKGNLYGTTSFSQSNSGEWGTVFELSPTSGGQWKETVLHTFHSTGRREKQGYSPRTELIFDAAGNLYGTTNEGGMLGGVVFELSSGSNGKWKEKVLHSFTGEDGYNPSSGLSFDTAGNLYGTTQLGGKWDLGVVFELTPSSGGIWKENVLHRFTGLRDGGLSTGGLLLDLRDNLYGTTVGGGTHHQGVVFEITR